MERQDAPAGAVSVKEDTWGSEVLAQGDLSPAATAAAARARIEARTVVALRNRRDEDLFGQQIEKLCSRPSFAATALYCKPVGKKQNAQGQYEEQYAIDWSIRAIQQFLRLFKNTDTRASILYDDARKTLLAVEVLDIENNVGHSREMMIEKTVERRDKRGRDVISGRVNSYGETVYLVYATGDEVRNKLGAETSKLLRDNGKRLLPADLLEMARATVDRINDTENAKDPDAAKKKILARFLSIGITADMLKAYLDRPLEGLSAKDVAELGVLFNGLKDGEFTWSDVMRLKNAPAEETPAADAPAETAKTGKLKDKILAAREGKKDAEK